MEVGTFLNIFFIKSEKLAQLYPRSQSLIFLSTHIIPFVFLPAVFVMVLGPEPKLLVLNSCLLFSGL